MMNLCVLVVLTIAKGLMENKDVNRSTHIQLSYDYEEWFNSTTNMYVHDNRM